jgi:hypothetical protein
VQEFWQLQSLCTDSSNPYRSIRNDTHEY